MAFVNPTTHSSYVGNGSDTDFGVAFYYIKGDDCIKVKLLDVTDPLNPVDVPLVEGVDYTIDETGYPNTEVIFATAPSSNQQVIVYRTSAPEQSSDFFDYRFDPDAVEIALDRIALQSQENRKALENAGLMDFFLAPSSTASTFYQLINSIVTSLVITGISVRSHTTGSTTAVANELISLTHPTNAVTVLLPTAPNNGDIVRVSDASGAFANKIIDGNGGTIVGKGSTYELTSEYESLTLVSDGASSWYIV